MSTGMNPVQIALLLLAILVALPLAALLLKVLLGFLGALGAILLGLRPLGKFQGPKGEC